MLTNVLYQSLVQLKLQGMAANLARQWEQPGGSGALSFEERLGLLVEEETSWRENRRLARLLRLARLRQTACVEDINYRHRRGLERGQMLRLAGCEWVRSHRTLLLVGPTGVGKSWLACALGQAACRQGLSARYERVPRLLEELRVARGDGSYAKRVALLGRVELLILDDFGLQALSSAERHDLLEVAEERHGRRATLITSQLPVARWHEYLGSEPTVADALLDRWLSGAERLELSGESLRRVEGDLTKGGQSD
jgi:DNA replication protein DnaC